MAQAATKMTYEEYLAIEEFPPGEKLEWINGETYAMSGARAGHVFVNASIIGQLYALVDGKKCRVGTPDLRILVEATGAHFFADAAIVCPPFETREGDVMSVSNPVVLVEVLSPSTRQYDLSDKWAHYRRIPSLRDCLFVDLASRSVQHYRRQGEEWVLRDCREGTVDLTGIDGSLDIERMFAGLDDVPLEMQ